MVYVDLVSLQGQWLGVSLKMTQWGCVSLRVGVDVDPHFEDAMQRCYFQEETREEDTVSQLPKHMHEETDTGHKSSHNIFMLGLL